ncbi:hypothetical protein ABW20_dc0105177 [Dactylellina cionopaga]|nr:hypothetical protein ABW20_dc0105177 [Dactylellina cionopaga]
MPLNLLQHKSWHVGSAKNQDRVRRDEREARLKEEEEERRMQLADAEQRLQILRQRIQSGTVGADVSLQIDHDDVAAAAADVTRDGSTEWGKRDTSSKKKRRRDEDDDIPLQRPPPTVATMKHSSSDAPLTGADGHINLFPPTVQKSTAGNKEYMAEKKKKEEEFEAQYTMKLSRPSEPWYSTADGVSEADKGKAEKVKNREGRVETRVREEHDPMNLMRKGVERLREVREETAVERRKRDAAVDIGLSADVEVLGRGHSRGHSHRHRSRSRSKERRRDRHRDGDRKRSHRSRSPRREKESSRSRHGEKREKETSAITKLREEKLAREEREREKARALVEDEMAFRRPERWTASAAGGRGKYSKQFGA